MLRLAPMTREPVAIREATDADTADVQRIYAYHVENGLASFEEIAPTLAEMQARRQDVLATGLPYLIAARSNAVVGYCYATRFRARSAYRFTLENSVYVDEAERRSGVGSLLLRSLIERCEGGPWRQMIAVIGDSGNAASIELHRRQGFTHAGTYKSAGFKFGRWVDSVLMQRALGEGDLSMPSETSGKL